MFEVPDDHVLADVICEKPEIVQHVLKHDSLLVNDEKEQVSGVILCVGRPLLKTLLELLNWIRGCF